MYWENVSSIHMLCVCTGEGVFYGKIDAGLVAGQDVVTFATKLIPYPFCTAQFCLCELHFVYVTRYIVLYY
jgi:hypothetical protein